MPQPLAIYEINTATWLHNLSRRQGRAVTLADVPDDEWDRIAGFGCQAVWLMGVWERSPAAIEINRQDVNFEPGMKAVLDDFEFDSDVIGSAYSIKQYEVSRALGGDEGLARAREQLKQRGLKLILDYVPNHVALDHPWATEHPEYFVGATEEELAADPVSYVKVGDRVLARGCDPQFDAWSDVLQLNVFAPGLRQAVAALLNSLTAKCDGVRCDMAMLLLNDIFSQTWKNHVEVPPETEFWADIIGQARRHRPDFLFIAEAYWDTQSQLLELGFDYCYDKTFYDCLVEDHPVSLKQHLKDSAEIQTGLVRFLENHDEPRVAGCFDWPRHQAAAVLLNSLPSALIYYEGQFAGYKVRTPVQLGRDPLQSSDPGVTDFYDLLLKTAATFRRDMTNWQLCPAKAYDLSRKPNHSLISCGWQAAGKRYLSVVNWSTKEVRAAVDLPAEATKYKLILATSHHKPYLEMATSSLSCQLSAWQAIVLEFGG